MGHFTGKYVGMLAGLITARRMKRGLSLQELLVAAYDNMTPTATKRKIPKYGVASIRVLMTNNKDKLRKLGWEIIGPQKTKNGFWLVPVER